jgi:hypothetical protein
MGASLLELLQAMARSEDLLEEMTTYIVVECGIVQIFTITLLWYLYIILIVY